jgi:hypothetical protein
MPFDVSAWLSVYAESLPSSDLVYPSSDVDHHEYEDLDVAAERDEER